MSELFDVNAYDFDDYDIDGETVHEAAVDDITFKAAELDRLESTVRIGTQAGAAVLQRNMVHLDVAPEVIVGRQSAIKELTERPELRDRVVEVIDGYARFESGLTRFLDGDVSVGSYKQARKATAKIAEVDAAAATEDQVQSPYLRSVLDSIRGLNEDEAARRLRARKLYFTMNGLQAGEDKNWYEPFFRFRPVWSGRIGVFAAADWIAANQHMIPITSLIAIVPLSYGAAHLVLPGSDGSSAKDRLFNDRTAYTPLRRGIAQSQSWLPGMEALAELDIVSKLSAWQSAVESHGNATTFANLDQSERFSLRAKDIRNPLLARTSGRMLVANTISLGGDYPLTFVTGPNSGGKSTASKAVVQNQVFAQIGGPVVATEYTTTLADHIDYHVPSAPDLDNDTGRFGFESARMRTILDRASHKSLTVLDDCLDGTTHEERLRVLEHMMMAFKFIGGATIFSTHAHELVGDFEEHGVGQFLQVEFDGENPTYRLVPGVSHTSHADRVARLHGFGKDQVTAEIIRRTGQTPQWF